MAASEEASANARSLAGALGREGFTIITGGGPGIMEAANRGARDAGATSVGLNIELPFEQHANPYLDVSLTFDHYVKSFAIGWNEFGIHWRGAAWSSFWTTMQIALISAPLTAAIGLLTAYLLVRQNFAGKEAFEFGTMLSFAIPGTVIGVSYVIAFNVPPIEITGTGIILVLSFIFRNMPVGVRAGVASMSQIDRSLDESSLTLGANSWQTFRKVVLPLLRPAILAALVYSFVRAMTAISAVIFLVSAQYDMSTSYIVGRVENNEYGIAIAYSAVLIGVMLVVIGLMQLVVGSRNIGRGSMAAVT